MKKGSAGYFLLWLALVLVVWAISGLNKKAEPAVAAGPERGGQQSMASALPALAPESPVPAGAEAGGATQEQEMVGIWVPFMALETAEGSEKAFKENFDAMADKAKGTGVNNLFVHVRPFGDALYPSDYYPWSHIVTGTQGKDPGFDPLEYMVQSAHDKGLKLHAWINPLRIKTAKTPAVLSDDSPYVQMGEESPYYFLALEGNVYLNPAYARVRKLIADGAAEIASKYPVDGIHFDDYFYPEDMGESDSEAYETYCAETDNPLSLKDWRVANINAMVSQVYRAVKAAKPDMPFGISPQGNIGNNYDLGADVFSWCSTKGYIDYICPQLYFSYDNPALGFIEALDSWMNIATHEDLKIYAGLGLYKAGTDSDEGTWQGESDMIARQIALSRKSGCDGVVFFDIDSLDSAPASAEVNNAKKLLNSR